MTATPYLQSGRFFSSGEAFTPQIFQTKTFGEAVPAGFDAVSLAVSLKLSYDLDFSSVLEQADAYIASGLKIFWDLDLGLFKTLKCSLDHQGQLAALTAGLDEFVEKVLESRLSNTLGVCLYRGDSFVNDLLERDHLLGLGYGEWLQSKKSLAKEEDVRLAWPSEKEMHDGFHFYYAHEVAVSFIEHLATRLPKGLPVLFVEDASLVGDSLQQAQVYAAEHLHRLEPCLKNASASIAGGAYEEGALFGFYFGRNLSELKERPEETVAVLLPSLPLLETMPEYHQLLEVINRLEELRIPIRLIPESLLTMSWENIDDVIAIPSVLGAEAYRGLRGFCAAGGTAVSAAANLGLPQEMTLAMFFETHSKAEHATEQNRA